MIGQNIGQALIVDILAALVRRPAQTPPSRRTLNFTVNVTYTLSSFFIAGKRQTLEEESSRYCLVIKIVILDNLIAENCGLISISVRKKFHSDLNETL